MVQLSTIARVILLSFWNPIVRGSEYVKEQTYIHVTNNFWETDISCDQFLQDILYDVFFSSNTTP